MGAVHHTLSSTVGEDPGPCGRLRPFRGHGPPVTDLRHADEVLRCELRPEEADALQAQRLGEAGVTVTAACTLRVLRDTGDRARPVWEAS